MQCASCGFENMPGSEACARCASSLSIATAVMDVRPPRAGKFKKKIRKVIPSRAIRAVRDEFVTTRTATAAVRARFWHHMTWQQMPPWSICWRMFIPGSSHFHIGQRVRGHAYLWSFFACLIPGLLLLGTTWGSFWLGMAFSVHASAITDLFNQYLPKGNFAQVLARSLWVTITLAAVVYLPIWWLGSWCISLRTLQLEMGPFKPGDVVVMNPWIHNKDWPRVGQVVLYHLPSKTIETTHGNGGHGRRLYIFQGERIDRVIATGGDTVTIDNRVLLINGTPTRHWPLNPDLLPKKLSIRVPKDCVLIFPTTTPNMDQSTSELWYELSLVPKTDVEATVYARWQPASRMWFIR